GNGTSLARGRPAARRGIFRAPSEIARPARRRAGVDRRGDEPLLGSGAGAERGGLRVPLPAVAAAGPGALGLPPAAGGTATRRVIPGRGRAAGRLRHRLATGPR